MTDGDFGTEISDLRRQARGTLTGRAEVRGVLSGAVRGNPKLLGEYAAQVAADARVRAGNLGAQEAKGKLLNQMRMPKSMGPNERISSPVSKRSDATTLSTPARESSPTPVPQRKEWQVTAIEKANVFSEDVYTGTVVRPIQFNDGQGAIDLDLPKGIESVAHKWIIEVPGLVAPEVHLYYRVIDRISEEDALVWEKIVRTYGSADKVPQGTVFLEEINPNHALQMADPSQKGYEGEEIVKWSDVPQKMADIRKGLVTGTGRLKGASD